MEVKEKGHIWFAKQFNMMAQGSYLEVLPTPPLGNYQLRGALGQNVCLVSIYNVYCVAKGMPFIINSV
jgi:hypothetical protein